MKYSIVKIVSIVVFLITTTSSFAQKLVSQKTSISLFSHTAVEDIKSNNFRSVSTLDTFSGDLVFSVPMQSFEFEKELMQKHFNSSDFLDTKKEPKAKLVGKITNLSQINFKKDGTYNAEVSGELTIKGTTKTIREKATIIVKGTTITLKSMIDIILVDYGIAFKKGKPSTNIAKSIETTVEVEF
ncbi:YceI family protein [Flavobacterium sp.]|uniref:YceI family protein n=1 Tax=Flavobacterium sp. TaxID=239 RepID=UPI0037506BE8